MTIRPKKFDRAKICAGCKIEFIPDDGNKGFCKTCDVQNAGTSTAVKKEPDNDLVSEGKTERLERDIVNLSKRVLILENSILHQQNDDKVETGDGSTKKSVKGHHPTVCKICGETFIAQWPAEKTCEKCKGDK